jgi:hypothetical protein
MRCLETRAARPRQELRRSRDCDSIADIGNTRKRRCWEGRHDGEIEWIDEYGDPTEEDAFGWLYTLSPYHHVVRGTDYPSVLLVSADHDDRVDPLHARKMAAALQAASASDNPVLLWTQRNAGHSGASSFDDYLTQSTDTLSFLAHETGLVIPERVRSAAPSRRPPVPPPSTWRNADRFAPRTAARW